MIESISWPNAAALQEVYAYESIHFEGGYQFHGLGVFHAGLISDLFNRYASPFPDQGQDSRHVAELVICDAASVLA
jgi:hypothetical protein